MPTPPPLPPPPPLAWLEPITARGASGGAGGTAGGVPVGPVGVPGLPRPCAVDRRDARRRAARDLDLDLGRDLDAAARPPPYPAPSAYAASPRLAAKEARRAFAVDDEVDGVAERAWHEAGPFGVTPGGDQVGGVRHTLVREIVFRQVGRARTRSPAMMVIRAARVLKRKQALRPFLPACATSISSSFAPSAAYFTLTAAAGWIEHASCRWNC